MVVRLDMVTEKQEKMLFRKQVKEQILSFQKQILIGSGEKQNLQSKKLKEALEMNDKTVTKHKFYYGEETYTICITMDDWWLDEPVDMSEGMMRAGEEFALENGMLPPKGLCAGCWKGTYEDIVEDYHIGGETIKDLDLNRCPKCGHTTLPWTSVEKVDKVLEEAKKAKKSL